MISQKRLKFEQKKISGGLSGYPGFYIFTHGSNHSDNLPKSTMKVGAVGGNGQDAVACKSTAMDISMDVSTHKKDWGTRRVRVLVFYFKQHINEPRCPDNFVASTEEISKPAPRVHLDIVPGVIEYKSVLFKNMKKNPFKRFVEETYDAIESNPVINGAYGVGGFAMEANALEKQYNELNELFDMYPLYRNLLKRIENYSSVNEAQMPEIDRKVLRLLHTILSGKAASIRTTQNSDLIIDIEGFLASTIRNIDSLDDIGRTRMINTQCDQYKNGLLEKVNEAKGYIENDIEPEIDRFFEKLLIEMDKTVDEVITLQAATIKEIQRKEGLAKEIEKQSKRGKILNTIKTVVSACATFVNPVYGAIATKAINIAEKKVVGSDIGIGNIQSNFVFRFRQFDIDEMDAIESELNKLKNALKQINVQNPELDEKLAKLLSEVATVKSSKSIPYDKIQGILDGTIKFVADPQHYFDKINFNMTGTIVEDVLKPFQKASNALAVISSSIPTYKKFAENDQKLDAIGQAINQDKETLRALYEFEKQIHTQLKPMIDVMQSNLDDVEKNLDDKSLVGLNVQKWKVGDTLRAIQKSFGDVMQGFQSEYRVINYMQRINEAMNLIINIFDRIQNYQEQTEFAVYLSQLHLADYRNLNVDNVQLRDTINQLQFNLQSNIILGQYDRAVDAFKQAIFPFAAEYLDIYQLPAALLTTSKTDQNMDSVIGTVVDNIKSLNERIQIMNTTVINKNDMSIYNAYFDSSDNANGPFYVWQNSDVREKVEQLFAGQKIYLLADVKKSSKLNAVKFRSIGLGFRSSNSSMNDRLNEILQSFHLSLTHMGESNYRCDNQFYTIHSRPLIIDSSFGERKDAPTVRNFAYDKLNAGIPLLSPYTLWAVQLSHGQFDSLRGFADSVDIELNGYGQYVSENAKICKTNLVSYYLRQNA